MKKYKQFVAGFVVATMLFGFNIAYAGSKTIDAFYNNIKISLENKIIELKDAKGNTVEPFICEGTTYLPARAIAEALGLEVKYNETTNTIELAKKKDGDKKMIFNPIDAKEYTHNNMKGIMWAASFFAPINELEKNKNIKVDFVNGIYSAYNTQTGLKVEIDPNSTNFGIPSCISFNNTAFINYDYINKIAPYKTIEEENSTAVIFDRSIGSWSILKEDGIEIMQYKDGRKFVMPYALYSFLDKNHLKCTTDDETHTLAFYNKDKTVILSGVKLVELDRGIVEYAIPYEDYKNNVLPKLLESIKVN